MTTMSDERCGTCNVPQSEHNGFRHPFAEPDSPTQPKDPLGGKVAGADRREKGEGRATIIPDVALRLALLEAGVITQEQLGEADRKMKAAFGR